MNKAQYQRQTELIKSASALAKAITTEVLYSMNLTDTLATLAEEEPDTYDAMCRVFTTARDARTN